MYEFEQLDFEQGGAMEKKHRLGKFILDTSHQMKVSLDSSFGDANLNGLQARILGFVEQNDEQGKDVYQKDIEAEFKIRRSSVSSVLDTMEKNGYIMRQSVASDARLKKLVLTEKSIRFGQHYKDSVEYFENSVEKGFTEEEIETLKYLLNKVYKNVQNMKTKNND